MLVKFSKPVLSLLACAALSLSCFSYAISSEEAPEVSPEPTPKPLKVDAMYKKDATEGIPMRYPGEATFTTDEILKIKTNGSVEKSPILDVAFSMLETGNPFLERYNIITGSTVEPLLEYGIPYFYGGRKMYHVLSRVPDYRTWVEWQDSKIYYRKDMRYFLGLDCRGFIDYVAQETGSEAVSISSKKNKKNDPDRLLFSFSSSDMIDWFDLASKMQIGDTIAIYHPGLHTMMYIGTLADYGYTEEDFPEDPSILRYPLVIHSGVNAVYADWFYQLKQEHRQYRSTSVPDGGVSVSVLGFNNKAVLNSIIQQKQETLWITLPDLSWLTIIPWDTVEIMDIYR